MAGVEIRIEGLRPFLRKLKRIQKPRRRKSLLTQTLNAGLGPVKNAMRKEIRSNNAIREGHLLKSITSKIKAYGSGVVVMLVGAKDKKNTAGENPGNYFHLVDLGTKAHTQHSGKPVWINGQWRMKAPGPYQHPGATRKPIRTPAMASIDQQVITKKILAKADKVWTKELARGN